MLAGCEGQLSTLEPAGPAAQTISNLWWVMFAGSAAILGLVMVLLAMAFRAKRPTSSDLSMERVWIVGMGLVFTMTVLAVLLAYGTIAGERLSVQAARNPVEVAANASKSGWTFTYKDNSDTTTRGVLHIPAGQDVVVAITTSDVVHSFWVPRLAGKLDAIPGHVNRLRLRADRAGRYAGRSAEYSGPGYYAHRFEVRAHDPQTWQAFLRGETN